MSEQKRYIKFKDRCRTSHAGSSTCPGCDPDCWLEESPHSEIGTKVKTFEDVSIKLKENIGEKITISTPVSSEDEKVLIGDGIDLKLFCVSAALEQPFKLKDGQIHKETIGVNSYLFGKNTEAIKNYFRNKLGKNLPDCKVLSLLVQEIPKTEIMDRLNLAQKRKKKT